MSWKPVKKGCAKQASQGGKEEKMWIRLMAFLATIIFIAVGTLLLLALQGDFLTLSQVISFIEQAYTNLNSRLVLLYTGLGLLALGLFNVYLAILSFRRKAFVRIAGSQGEIRIAYGTIENLVEKISRDLGGIDRISTRIISRKKKISLEIRLSLGAVTNVVDISHRLQELVREEMQDVLGIANLGEVKIVVRKIALGRRKAESENILERGRTSRGIELHH
jgi:uncharacterized alkaline shock family protein YloU